MVKYRSDRHFRFWAYIASHSSLLLRSGRLEDDNGKASDQYTIDIEFWEASYMELPDSFYGVELLERKLEYPERLTKFVKSGTKIFELKSNDASYYVIAAGCLVGRSRWDYRINRLYNLGLEYEEILYNSNND